jgi:hypothetical protein
LTVAAHLIVGANEEPFLPALLESLDGVADILLVNDNSGTADGPNARALHGSAFGARGRLVVDAAPFVDFAEARNRVLALHRTHVGHGWAAFVDADEVHHGLAAMIARNLPNVPADVAAIDAYTRHFVQSFGWYSSIERRLMFFRFTPNLRWEGAVHERLTGMDGTRLAIPYVYEHYGWVLPTKRLAAKGRQYAGLGQVIESLDGVDDAVDADRFLRFFWPKAMRFHGRHPLALAPVRAALEQTYATEFARAEPTVRHFQPPQVRVANVVRRANFELRWRARGLDRRAATLLASDTINRYERKWSSQNGEDGILHEIFRRIGATAPFFVEFGVEDGRECNTAALVRAGWNGMMIEGDPQKFAALSVTYADAPAVRLVNAYVTAENIAGLFAANGVPTELDLLSIDIDGNDYWVWEALAAYRPRVVVIEYNATHPPPERWVMTYDPAHRWGDDTYYGAGLASLAALGARLGYALIGTEVRGVNAFFVREDVLPATGFPRLGAAEAYHPPTVGHRPGDGPFEAR